MTRVLGIDPGSCKTGFGIVRAARGEIEYVASGVIRLPTGPLPERLKRIYHGLVEVIGEYQPEQMAIEQVFMSKSAGSALKLGQARGAAIVAAVAQALPVAEYEARKVKQSVVGRGGADKAQVQQMVKTLLNLASVPQEDAADALAVAICHINTQSIMDKLAQATHFRRGRVV